MSAIIISGITMGNATNYYNFHNADDIHYINVLDQYLGVRAKAETITNNGNLRAIIDDTRQYIKETIKNGRMYLYHTNQYNKFGEILGDLYEKIGELSDDDNKIEQIVQYYKTKIQQIKIITKGSPATNTPADFQQWFLEDANDVITKCNNVISKLKEFRDDYSESLQNLYNAEY